MAQAQGKISILIATYGRAELCQRSLRSVYSAMTQTSGTDFEIVVGINGEDRETAVMLQELKSEPLGHLLDIKTFARRKTPAACRNDLLPFTCGEWIYFLDDDAYVDPDFFHRFLASPMRDECVAVGGPNLNPPLSGFFQNSSSRALASRFATYFSSARYVPRGIPRPCSEESLILCNLFVRRRVLSHTSFLDTLVCAEENWLLQNLKLENHRLGYDPGLCVWHERRPDLVSFVRQVFKYGFGRGQIFRRRPSGLHWAHLLPLLCLLYTCALALSIPHNGKMPGNFWLAPFPVYAGLCLAFAAVQRSLASALLFPVIHVSYGWGLFCGIFRG